MFILKICAILLSIGIIFLVFLKMNKQKEYFDEDKTKSKVETSDSITTLLKNAKNEINANKDEWLIYNAAKDKDNYVLTLDKSVEPVYTIKISKSNNGETLYTVNGADNKTAGTNGIQEDEGTPSSYGMSWHIILFGDELAPNNPLAPGNRRKSWLFNFLFLELGAGKLRHY